MFNKTVRVIFVCMVMCMAQTGVTWARTYYLGVLPLRKPTEMLKRFEGVEKYLSKETGLDIHLRLYPTSGVTGGYTAIVKDIVAGKIDFAFLAPVTCVQAVGSGPVIPFVCAQKAGSPVYYGHLAVKIDSAYQSFKELKGEKVCGTSASSTSGNLMPTGWLQDQGIDKFEFFQFEYLGRHDKAAQAVIIGQFEGCFINEATFNQYNEEEQQLRSLWRHPAVPEFPLCVNTEVVSPEVLEKVKEALLNLHEKDIKSLEAINKKYEKWVPIEWDDYGAVKKVCDSVHGPKFYDLDYWQKKADK
ncbi:MAG: phosphate/phosphite/phosphonate ABC transporter substrate-binding protein [Candidatus Omnitrophica bacterium]|nr:phosphate/phosphite/phosphonate ABC transporter substrate-binding protein [Candidatus Omnitrophota bacterium]